MLLILLSEPHGKVPLFIDDWRPFRPKNAMEWAAWAAAKIGLVDPIPYQPIGGLKRARGGFVDAGHAGAAWARSRRCAPTTRRTSCSRT